MSKSVASVLTVCLVASLSLDGCGSPSAAPAPGPTSAEGGEAPSATSTGVPEATSPSSGSGACSNPLFPIVPGATWSYTLTGGPSGPVTYTSTVQSVDDSGFVLVQVIDTATVTQRWSCADAGLVALDFGGVSATFATGGTQASFTTVSQTGVTLPKAVSDGDSWMQSFEVEGAQNMPDGSTAHSQGQAGYQSTAMGFEEVTVAAGTFNAMRVDGTLNLDLSVDVMGVTAPFTLATTISNWYAPGVGVVKVTQSGEMMGAPVTVDNELTAYSIP